MLGKTTYINPFKLRILKISISVFKNMSTCIQQKTTHLNQLLNRNLGCGSSGVIINPTAGFSTHATLIVGKLDFTAMCSEFRHRCFCIADADHTLVGRSELFKSLARIGGGGPLKDFTVGIRYHWIYPPTNGHQWCQWRFSWGICDLLLGAR